MGNYLMHYELKSIKVNKETSGFCFVFLTVKNLCV